MVLLQQRKEREKGLGQSSIVHVLPSKMASYILTYILDKDQQLSDRLIPSKVYAPAT